MGQPRFSWRVASDGGGGVERYWLFRQPTGWTLLTTIRASGESSLDCFDSLFDLQVHVEDRLGPSLWAEISDAAQFSAHELYERP